MATKILHIVEATATGTLSMLSLLANRQAKMGDQVTVVYSRRPETPADLNSLFDEQIRLTNVQMYSLQHKIVSVLQIRKIISQGQFDTVFLHSSFAGFIGRVAAFFSKDNASYFYIPHCISFMRKDISQLKKLCFVFLEWIGAMRRCDYVACSRSEQEIIRHWVPFRMCHLVENAINLDPLPSIETVPAQECIITVGQIRPQKNPEEFAAIFKIVKSKRPHTMFIWIGDGDPHLRTKLEQSGVEVTGWLAKNEVCHRLGRASLYLSTARWEGMPVSIIEACFYGLPVVASRCSGNVDVIEDGETGWLYKTPAHAAGLIMEILDGKRSFQEIRNQARKRVEQRYSIDRYLYQMQLLSQPNRNSTAD